MLITFHALMLRSEKNNAVSERKRLVFNFDAFILMEIISNTEKKNLSELSDNTASTNSL